MSVSLPYHCGLIAKFGVERGSWFYSPRGSEQDKLWVRSAKWIPKDQMRDVNRNHLGAVLGLEYKRFIGLLALKQARSTKAGN